MGMRGRHVQGASRLSMRRVNKVHGGVSKVEVAMVGWYALREVKVWFPE
jgi:hypothetical protein